MFSLSTVGPLECTWPNIDYPSNMVEVEFHTLNNNDDFIYEGVWYIKFDEMCAKSMYEEKIFDCYELVTVER
jgi:hypothetical protein